MAHRQTQEGDIHALDVFDGFRDHFVPLTILGALSLLYLGISAVVADDDGLVGVSISYNVTGTPLNTGFKVALDFFDVLMICVPALVVLAERGVRKCLFTGMGAVLKNWRAFLVVGIAGGSIAFCLFGGSLLLTLVLQLVTANLSGMLRVVCDNAFTISGTALSMLLAGLIALMSYTATRDIFYEEG